MITVVGVKFRHSNKIYSFAPGDWELNINDKVIVETIKGTEMGTVASPITQVEQSNVVAPLKEIIRKATQEDLNKAEESKSKESEAFAICEKKIADHKIAMKLVGVEATFDMSKILFYFTADGRVDFRELVKYPLCQLANGMHLGRLIDGNKIVGLTEKNGIRRLRHD